MPYCEATACSLAGVPDTSATQRPFELWPKAGRICSSASFPRPTTAKPTRCSGGSGAGVGPDGVSAAPRHSGNTTRPSFTVPVSTTDGGTKVCAMEAGASARPAAPAPTARKRRRLSARRRSLSEPGASAAGKFFMRFPRRSGPRTPCAASHEVARGRSGRDESEVALSRRTLAPGSQDVVASASRLHETAAAERAVLEKVGTTTFIELAWPHATRSPL